MSLLPVGDTTTRDTIRWASDLFARGLVAPQRAAWCAKPEITFSDAIAAVRRHIWIQGVSPPSRPDRDTVEIPRELDDRLVTAERDTA